MLWSPQISAGGVVGAPPPPPPEVVVVVGRSWWSWSGRSWWSSAGCRGGRAGRGGRRRVARGRRRCSTWEAGRRAIVAATGELRHRAAARCAGLVGPAVGTDVGGDRDLGVARVVDRRAEHRPWRGAGDELPSVASLAEDESSAGGIGGDRSGTPIRPGPTRRRPGRCRSRREGDRHHRHLGRRAQLHLGLGSGPRLRP